MDKMDTRGNKTAKKKKTKLKTILRGVATEPLYIITGDKSERFKMTLKDLGSLPRSSIATGTEAGDIKSKNKMLKQDLVFGVNEIMRRLRKSDCNILGLVVTNPLSSHLQLAIHDATLHHKVPCLSLDGLHEMSYHLNLSSLTAFAFLNSCKYPGSGFYSLYKLFVEIYEEKTESSVEKSNVPSSKKCIEKTKEELTCQTTIRPTAEQLYVSTRSRKFFPTSSLHSNTPQNVDNDCIVISKDEAYFPARYCRDILKLTVMKSMESDSFVDQSFAKRLVDTPLVEPSAFEIGGSSDKVKFFKADVLQVRSTKRGNKRNRNQTLKKPV